MGSVYYSSEKHGLEIFDELDEDGLSYEYNMFVIWRSIKDGRLFYAIDSGCSCPSPFEDFNTIADLTPIDHNGFTSFMQVLREWNEYNAVSPVEVEDIIKKVQRALV